MTPKRSKVTGRFVKSGGTMRRNPAPQAKPHWNNADVKTYAARGPYRRVQSQLVYVKGTHPLDHDLYWRIVGWNANRDDETVLASGREDSHLMAAAAIRKALKPYNATSL